jgi:hypothetical protein
LHAPQLFESAQTSTHLPPQSVGFVPPEHVSAGVHFPWTQSFPLTHCVPHDPQCAVSLDVSTHALPHGVCPVAHVGSALLHAAATKPTKKIATELCCFPPMCSS